MFSTLRGADLHFHVGVQMLNAFFTSFICSVACMLLISLLSRSRKQEVDLSGRPVLRYFWAPYLLLACGVVWFGIGAYQWFDPDNHRYSGNLLLLSYIPALIGVLSFCLVCYLVRYHVVLTATTIEVYRWPFATQTYRLCDLDRIENKGPNTVLHFLGKKQLVIYAILSGRDKFLSALTAASSSRSKLGQPRH